MNEENQISGEEYFDYITVPTLEKTVDLTKELINIQKEDQNNEQNEKN